MQRKLAVLLAFCLGVGLATVVAQQKSRDAVAVDPDVHQVVLENDQVRVLEAQAAPGYKSPMHTHPPRTVLVSLGSARVKMKMPDGQTQIMDFRPGSVVWRDKAAEHSWELLSGNLHVVGIEIKGAPAAKGN